MDDGRRKKIAMYLERSVDLCDDCPIEKICDEQECNLMWEKFFRSKIKEKDILEV